MDPRMLTVLALCAIAISALPHSAHPDEVVAERGSEPFPSAELVSKQWQAQPQQTPQPIQLAPKAVSALRKAPKVALRATLAPKPLAKAVRLHKVSERGALLGAGQVVSNKLPAQSQSQRKPVVRPAMNVNDLRKASKVAIRDTLAPKSLAKPAAAPWLRKVTKRGALIGTAAQSEEDDCSACFEEQNDGTDCHLGFITVDCLTAFEDNCGKRCSEECGGDESGACCAYNALQGPSCETVEDDEDRLSCVLDECSSERQSINSIKRKAEDTKDLLTKDLTEHDGSAKALLRGMNYIIGEEAERLKEEARYQDEIAVMHDAHDAPSELTGAKATTVTETEKTKETKETEKTVTTATSTTSAGPSMTSSTL